MNHRINNYKFMSTGTIDHLGGHVRPDLHKGFLKIAQGITAHLDRYAGAHVKIQANHSLSKSGKQEKIEAAAKSTYEDIHRDRGKIHELEHCDASAKILFNAAEVLLSTETDIISDIANAEISTEDGSDG